MTDCENNNCGKCAAFCPARRRLRNNVWSDGSCNEKQVDGFINSQLTARQNGAETMCFTPKEHANEQVFYMNV
jgi:hypothetical protein